ncbi:MAG: hypothetical protein FRX49_06588 [Trebouxia sp. A1-2]|nr:MAG: hypothetical protein FRX49_06588 [Trebouxia sp. A1-2]
MTADLPGGARTGGRSSPGIGPEAALAAAAAPLWLVAPVVSVLSRWDGEAKVEPPCDAPSSRRSRDLLAGVRGADNLRTRRTRQSEQVGHSSSTPGWDWRDRRWLPDIPCDKITPIGSDRSYSPLFDIPPEAQRRDAAHCKEALLPTAVANSPPVACACHLAAPKRSTTRPGRWVDSSRRMRFATCAFPPKRDKDAMMMAAIRPPCSPESQSVAVPFGQTCEGIDQIYGHRSCTQAQTDLSRSGCLIRHPLRGWAHWVETGFWVLQCEDGLKHHGAQAACVCTLP